MVCAFFQFAFTIEAFLDTHGFGAFFDFLDQIFHFVQTAGDVALYCIVELLQTEFHVMEVRDGFTQRAFRNVGQHGLEIAESLASFVGKFRVNLFVALAVRDEQTNTPIAVSVEIIQFVIFCRKESQDFAVNVIFTFFFQFLTDMRSNYLDIVPDETATEKDAFANPRAALRYLYSCYGYLPQSNMVQSCMDFTGDETISPFAESYVKFAEGSYDSSNTIISYWNTLFQGIRQCYLLKENIHSVPKISQDEVDLYTPQKPTS